MITETNKRLLENIFTAINTGSFNLLDGHPGFWETRQVVPPMHALFADWHTAGLQQIAEAHKVFSYGIFHLTHVGSFASVAPTQQRIILEGFFLDQVQDGIVVEHNGTTNWPDVIRQLGHPRFQALPVRVPRMLTRRVHARSDEATRAANKALVAQLLAAVSQGDAEMAPRGISVGQLRSEVMAIRAGIRPVNKATVTQLLTGLSQGDAGAAMWDDGIEQLHADFATIRAAFPDLHYTLVMQVAEGELVGTRATLHGTHTGRLFGFAPTGRSISWDYFSFARVVDGALVEHNGAADWTAALLHLGLLPLA